MSDALVLTPGGYRPKEQVHLVEPNRVLRLVGGRLKELDAEGKVVADHGLLAARPPGLPLMPRNVVRRRGRATELASGWISYADWTNVTGKPISYFATTWTVPPAPSSDSGQTLYLFDGMQDSSMIYQPVLQWGPSPAGGGSRWMVASWYVDGEGGPAFHSPLCEVEAGDVLAGFMTLTGRSAGGMAYRCEFKGLPDSNLAIQDVPELTWCCQTLEAYEVTKLTDYPDTGLTAFRAIDLRVGVGPSAEPALAWTAVDAESDVGQHTVIVSNANPGGEIDIHYR